MVPQYLSVGPSSMLVVLATFLNSGVICTKRIVSEVAFAKFFESIGLGTSISVESSRLFYPDKLINKLINPITTTNTTVVFHRYHSINNEEP